MIKNIIYGSFTVNKMYLGTSLFWLKPTLEDYILLGNGQEALDYAVLNLLGSNVVWNLDVENKQITYTNN